MDRRRFLLASLAGALATPLAGEAQQPKVHRIGFLQPPQADNEHREAFRQALRYHGYVEGQNIVIEDRISTAPKDLSALLADLVGRKVDVIFTWTTPALVAAKKATRTIPIVGFSGDPVQMGLVTSLAKPGGNLTGLAILTDELELKKLQLLMETAPSVTRVAVLSNPDNPVWPSALKRLKEAAPTLGVKLQPLEARASGDLEAAFAAATKEKAGALQVVEEQTFLGDSQRIVDFAAMRRLPSMYSSRRYVRQGGLMSYGVAIDELIRRSAAFADKILKGADPGDLPIEQPTKFVLVINLKTAKALGLTIPPSLLARADQVIE